MGAEYCAHVSTTQEILVHIRANGIATKPTMIRIVRGASPVDTLITF